MDEKLCDKGSSILNDTFGLKQGVKKKKLRRLKKKRDI